MSGDIADCVVGVLIVQCGWHVTGAVWIALTLSVNNLLMSCCILGSSYFSYFLSVTEIEHGAGFVFKAVALCVGSQRASSM